MAKDKKKKKEKKDKKSTGKSGGSTGANKLKILSQNPIVADIVAAALVATASALKDSKKARRLASEAGDELAKLSRAGAEKGNALWDMAVEIGRRSLEELTVFESPKRAKPKASTKARASAKGRASTKAPASTKGRATSKGRAKAKSRGAKK